MTPNEFIDKWRGGGKERAEAQSFFNDLCHLVRHQTPREADPTRTWFAFEYGAEKTVGGKGFADAWKKGYFGWEAKGTGRSLQDAYVQLKMYSDDLQNPPLLVVSDLHAFEIHTNFTNTVKEVHRFTIEDLVQPQIFRKVRAMFHNPEELRPGTKRSDITKEAAQKFADLAWDLRNRGHAALEVAHFLNRLVFCMFAEDIGLLPDQLFTRMVAASQNDPEAFQTNAAQLFEAMRKGGQAGFVKVEWFNGGLFNDDSTLPLNREELRTLLAACHLSWDQIDPSIFGTLFERGLDPEKRSQLGAHYTDPETIMRLVRPVVIEPLLAQWGEEKLAIAELMEKANLHGSLQGLSKAEKASRTLAHNQAKQRFSDFLDRLRAFTVLDPACGSGNFLFMSLRALKDLEHRVMIEGSELGLERQILGVGPAQVMGIELNEYAAELARITVWIGELQWMVQNGYGARKNPILHPLDQIQCRDALINDDDTETEWPEADAILGNPPFIGGHRMRSELGEEYTDQVRAMYAGRVSSGADFVCFWFEKARQAIVDGRTTRAGLVATNSIRHGKNRLVLGRIKSDMEITAAWSSLEWWDNGTAVDVSLIAFAQAPTPDAVLDGRPVPEITSSLTELVHHDIAKAPRLPANRGVSFQGVIPRAELKRTQRVKLGLDLPPASFNLEGPVARQMLVQPSTPGGEPMSAVIRPYMIADDITDRPYDRFTINFGTRTQAEASMFDGPFKAIENVRLHRAHMKEKNDRESWWLMSRPRPKMVSALEGLSRYIAIPRHSKHYVCSWVHPAVLPDSALVVVAKDDDATFGILQSSIHKVWGLRQGSALENRPRYTHTSSFETFPFPEGMTPDLSSEEIQRSPFAENIATAAKALVQARDRWLNPPEWAEFHDEVVPDFPPYIIAKPGHERDLAGRTMTSLYNEMPAWLASLHHTLDVAVAQAYGWTWPMEEEDILRALFEMSASLGEGADNDEASEDKDE
ncbi:class I SAM-dependent DNA methyltransferase [Luteimonas sp. MC1750]|uniref:class I SAM-dependent DNA methyltransferase n=1 Tax=Luteimonas sp. MC1750 TaxID=2799326 RepID=UPI0018F0C8D6|nr:class I SAM-dependent DNA methyltransferase [Luteimonas sp. MC1750]MBJ6983963.1 class I SAM-dependent DNA methyltransferase [Luteimonas sp. MC1750]QQO06776.1 class I SAM-dependent DNA methyltransferase [Luteimonas sp. MC1750]